MFKHILIPTDGSELSRRAVHVAVQLAKSLGAKLTAFHSIASYSLPISDGMTVYAEAFSPEDYESAEKYAADMLASIQAEAKGSGLEVDTLVVTAAAPWDAIIKAAASNKCDLIVMASHGRRGLEGLLLGSETTKVLTHSTIPVMVCR